MGAPSVKHLSQELMVVRHSNYMLNSIFQLMNFQMKKFGSFHNFLGKIIFGVSCKIWESFPEVFFFLLNFARNINHLWKK